LSEPSPEAVVLGVGASINCCSISFGGVMSAEDELAA